MTQPDNRSGQQRHSSDTLENELELGIYEAIVASSDDAIVSKTLNGTITSWNRAAERMFGYSAQEAIGQPITLIVPDELHQEEEMILAQLRQGKRIDHYETVRRRKDGSRVEVSLSISPVKNRAGTIIGAAKIARDISERKEVQRRKDAFLAITSHELKTPLATLKGIAQILLKKGERENLHSIIPLLQQMNTQADRLTRLVNEVLDASRMQTGQVTYREERVDLAALVQQTVALLQQVSPTHTLVVSAPKPTWVMGDKDRLVQVVTNLVGNAMKYSPQSSPVEITLTTTERNVTLAVRDHGVGIPKAHQKHLFDRFYRVPNAQTQAVSGLGLGLYITHEIIKRHGGEIRVESEEQQGTLFLVSLPRDSVLHHHVDQ